MANMTVGEFAGVPLQDVADTWRTGAVFLLRRPAVSDAVVSLNGWTTSVVAGERAVVASGPSSATDHAAAFSDALLAANQGLDYMSATGSTHSVIVDATGDCIVWWPDSAGERGYAGVCRGYAWVQRHSHRRRHRPCGQRRASAGTARADGAERVPVYADGEDVGRSLRRLPKPVSCV